MTTKGQERQAILKIRNIVEGLGENSYLGTAMDGVLEVAEQNIEYDAAFSLKGNAEVAERREQEQRERAEKLEKELEAARAELAQCKEWWKEQKKELMNELQEVQTEAKKYKMPEDMLESLRQVLIEYRGKAEAEMDQAAVMMANCVYVGSVSPDIQNAAERFKEKRAKVATCKSLLGKLTERYGEREENE